MASGFRASFVIEGDATKAVKAMVDVLNGAERLKNGLARISASASKVTAATNTAANNARNGWSRAEMQVRKYAASLGLAAVMAANLAKASVSGRLPSFKGASLPPAVSAGVGKFSSLVSSAAQRVTALTGKVVAFGTRSVAATALASAGLVKLVRGLGSTGSGFKSLDAGIKKFSSRFMEVRQQLMNVNDTLRLVTQGITNVGRALMFFVSMPLLGFFASMTASAVNFEDAMVRVQKTTGATSGQLKDLTADIRELAKYTATSHVDLAGIAEVLGQMGTPVGRIGELTDLFNKMAVATDMAAEEITTEMARISNAFAINLSESTERVEKLANVINMLENTTAASSREIITTLSGWAQVAHQLNITEANAAALSATLVSMGFSGEEAGTALRNLGVYLIRNVDGVVASMKATSKYSDKQKALNAINEDAVAVFIDLARAANEANDENQRAQALQALMEIGNLRGGRALAAMATNIDLVEKNLRAANNEWERGSSLMQEYERAMLSTKSQMGVLRNNVNDLGITIGDAILPRINELIQIAVPTVQILSDAFKKLSKTTQLQVVAFAMLVIVAGPLLMFVGQLVHAVALIVMGFGQLLRVVPFLASGFGSLVKAGALLSRVFLSWPGLILGAIVLILKALSRMGVDIAGFFKGLAAKAAAWGENLASNIANGLLAGAVRYVARAVAYIADLIASFFESHSPPKAGPLSTIDRWGVGLMKAFLKGFKNADFSILRDVGKAIEAILTRGVSDEALPNALKKVAKSRSILAKLIAQFNRTGVVDQSLLNQATQGLGQFTDEVKSLVTTWLEYEGLQRRIAELEARRKGVVKGYHDEIAAIGLSNMSLKDKVIAIRAAQRSRDESLRGLDREQEALEAQKEEMGAQLEFQKSMLDALNDQADLFQRIADALKKLAERSAGGSGVGEDPFGFGELDGTIASAQNAIDETTEKIKTLTQRIEDGRLKLQGFFDGFKGLPRQLFTKDTRDLGVAGGSKAPNTEVQEMYDILYDLGVRAAELKASIEEISGAAVSAFATAKSALLDFRESFGKGEEEPKEMQTSKAHGIFDNLAQGFAAAKPLQTFLISIAASAALVKRVFTAFFESLSRGFASLGKSVDGETVLKGIANILWFIGFLLGGIANGISFLIGLIISVFGSIASAVGWFIGVLTGLGVIAFEALSDIGQAIVDGFTDGFDAFKKASQDAAAKAIKNLIAFIKALLGISSPSTVFIEIAHDTVQGFIDGFSEWWGDVITTAEQKIDEFLDVVSGYVDAFMDIGEQIAKGLLDGLRSVLEKAMGMVPEPFKQWVRNFIDGLKIGSPSRLFMEYGGDVGTGFLMGIDNAMRSMSAMSAFSGVLAVDESTFGQGQGVFRITVDIHDNTVRSDEDLTKLADMVSAELSRKLRAAQGFGGRTQF